MIKYACLFLFLAIPFLAYSQSQPTGVIEPDKKMLQGAAGNANIGDVFTPNMFDGTVNVNIPIFNYGNNYGNFGVSLSYNTRGVKVDQLSSSVGLNWNLNASGTITRIIRDIPDEFYAEWPGGSSKLISARGKFRIYGTLGAGGSTTVNDKLNDDFIVSVGNLNFSFKLGKNGFIFTHPRQNNVKVELYVNGDYSPDHHIDVTSGKTLNFKITDNEGVEYFFEGGNKEKGKITDGNSNSSQERKSEYNVFVTWNIKKIKFPNGEEINYEYANSYGFENQVYTYCQTTEPASGGGHYNAINAAVYGSQIFSDVRRVITSIEYPNNIEVKFHYKDLYTQYCFYSSDQPLEEIEISSGDNCLYYELHHKGLTSSAYTDPENEIDLEYGYNHWFMSNRYRMILKKIKIRTCGTLWNPPVTEPYYEFEYNPIRLPDRLNGSQDFFGYYNEKNGTATQLIPYHTPISGGTSYGADRSDDVGTNSRKRAGNLTAIKNAYGGRVEFSYELHNNLTNVLGSQTGFPSSDPLFFGVAAKAGVRVSTILLNDPKSGSSSNKYMYFSYHDGQYFLTGGYLHSLYKTDMSNNPTEYKMHGFFVSPHQFINGASHGYSKVTVDIKNSSNDLISKTEYEFTNFKDGSNLRYHLNGSNKDYWQSPYTDKQYIRDWEIGLPLATTTQDANGMVTSKITNEYDFSIETPNLADLEYQVKEHKVIKGTADYMLPYLMHTHSTDDFQPFTGKARLKKTITSKYIKTNSQVDDEVTYEYDSRNNLKKITTKNSRGEFIELRHIYNYDISGPAVPGGNFPGTTLYNMTEAGQERLIATERWKKDPVSVYDDKLLDATMNVYAYTGGKAKLEKLYKMVSGVPIDYTTHTGLSVSNPSGNPYLYIHTAYEFGGVPDYMEKISSVELRNSNDYTLEASVGEQGRKVSTIWSENGEKIAEANVPYNELGYTGFEDGTNHNDDNIMYHPAFRETSIAVFNAEPFLGKYAFRLDRNDIVGSTVAIRNLTPGKTYRISCWVLGSPPLLSGGGIAQTALVYNSSKPIGDPLNGWKQHELSFTPINTSAVMLRTSASSDIYIDEVRVHPVGATVNTWSYEPLFGIKSHTDSRGTVTLFDYDNMGRQVSVRNHERQIVEKTDYYIAP